MTFVDFCTFIGGLLAEDGMGYIISSLVVVGMLVGAIVKHAGWGIKDAGLWLVVLFVYIAGVQVLVIKTSEMSIDNVIISIALMVFVLIFYQTGVMIGIWIVKRERNKSRVELRRWEEAYKMVERDKSPNNG